MLHCLCSSQCFNSISYWNCSKASEIETVCSLLEFQFISQVEWLLSPGRFLKRCYSQPTPSLSIHEICHSKIATCTVEWCFLAYSVTKPICCWKFGLVTKRIQTAVFTMQSSIINGRYTRWRNVIFTYLSRPCPSLLQIWISRGAEICLYPKVDEEMSNGIW